MKSLRKKIQAYMEPDDPIIDDLDQDDLTYLEDLLRELNKTGKEHYISKISKKGKILDVITNFRTTYIKK